MSSWRDATCGAVSHDHVGERITLAGWVDTRRDLGGLVFIELRDYSGKVQLVINPERAAEAAQTAHEIRNEFVLQAEGEVVRRTPETVNPNIPTGELEVQVDTLRILSRSDPLPFQIGDDVDEVLRLHFEFELLPGAQTVIVTNGMSGIFAGPASTVIACTFAGGTGVGVLLPLPPPPPA